ncbi:MAG: hypothetical protein F6K40_02980 [Okeania sp. SIO3I5]|uniref:hypothetical protein n=1 Tax=Okeania sp. SIO3I5 TaxID=2607805 RepID=UPI0013BD0FED|nr:hypothetical protein [Okeania sp. SIO3I5]NEQ35326.1 hypothetical protein [Okeania sp. SIO3I5]
MIGSCGRCGKLVRVGGVGGVGLKKCRVVNILAQTMNEQCLVPRSPTQALPYSLFSRDIKWVL